MNIVDGFVASGASVMRDVDPEVDVSALSEETGFDDLVRGIATQLCLSVQVLGKGNCKSILLIENADWVFLIFMN
jgi:hypothetical protein